MNPSCVLSVRDLSVHYRGRPSFFGEKRTIRAVEGVCLDLRAGETLGLVGESGCGKSSLGRAVIRLTQPTGGSIEINGRDFLGLKGEALRRARPDIQMVFQDPYASLDPRMTVLDVLEEPIRAHFGLAAGAARERIATILALVGIPQSALTRYPHEFSGGQRQRIAIARALILEPRILIADEPVSSLDVSVQAQVLNLLKDIQKRMNLSMLFISHNLAVVRYISHRVAVMYLGRIVEIGDSDAIYHNPLHPYTRALMSAVPVPDPRVERSRKRTILEGELPSPANPPSGCSFHTRCPYVVKGCRASVPALNPVEQSNQPATHLVRCTELHRIPS